MWPELDPTTAIVGIGDFNGDGITDLLLKSADGTYTDWLGQTDGSFADNSSNFDLNPGSDWHVVATGNFNGDGFDDVIWRSDSGTADDLLGATNGSFVGNPNFVLNPGADWHIVGTGDFNGDGLSDILWQSDSGTLNAFLGQSNGGFIGNVLATNPGAGWHVAGTGDFNGDGKDDILWRNDSGVISDWLGQADGTFVDNYANAANGSASTSWQVAGTGDFNGDGRTDILWRNTDGTIDDFLGQANGGFIDNYAVAMQALSNELQIAGVGNFDGDGRADVLIRESDGSVQTWVGSANGAILSPMEKVWQDAVAGVATFISEITHQIETAPPPPSDKDSGDTGMRYVPGPINAGVLDILGQITEVFDAGGVNVINVMATGDDSTFDLLYQDNTSFGVSFEDSSASNFDSMTLLDSSTDLYSFDINGIDLVANWLAGSTIGMNIPSSDAIVVTGILAGSSPDDPMAPPAGYLLFNPFDNNFNFNDGFGGAGGPTRQTALNATLSTLTVTTVGHHEIYTPPASSLTVDQKAASDALIQAIEAIDGAKIEGMAPGAQLTVTETWIDSAGQPHNVTVTETAADLADHWANTSFALFTSAEYAPLNAYNNGTGRGSANMGADPNMAGNIIAGFNIGDKTTGVTAYFIGNGIAALEYLALHEVAHESEAGMNMYLGTPDKLYNDFTPGSTNYADENFANTVALATMEALALSLDHYDPSLTTGKQTVRGDWQTDVIWTVNNQ